MFERYSARSGVRRPSRLAELGKVQRFVRNASAVCENQVRLTVRSLKQEGRPVSRGVIAHEAVIISESPVILEEIVVAHAIPVLRECGFRWAEVCGARGP